jgi:hypothetical protein
MSDADHKSAMTFSSWFEDIEGTRHSNQTTVYDPQDLLSVLSAFATFLRGADFPYVDSVHITEF